MLDLVGGSPVRSEPPTLGLLDAMGGTHEYTAGKRCGLAQAWLEQRASCQ